MFEYHMTVTQFVKIAVMMMMMVSKMGEFQQTLLKFNFRMGPPK